MKKKISAFDQLLEIIGGVKSPLREDNYQLEFHKHEVLKKLPSIGPCFFIVCDIFPQKILKVSEGVKTVLGFTSDEIKQEGISFFNCFMHPRDKEQCLKLAKMSWEFLNSLSCEQRLNYANNFYYRAVKKDGHVIMVQHQAIPLELDVDGNLLLDCHIITDISHLNLPEQVKLSIINPSENSCFTATCEEPHLAEKSSRLSKREMEVLKLIMQGLNSKQIAEQLFISYYTVRTHRRNILEKLGKKNTAEMISYVLFQRIV